METSQDVNEIFNSLILFRAQLQQPTKDAKNPFFAKGGSGGYVTLEGVMKSIDQALSGTGLAYVQIVANDANGGVGVETILTHKSGQFLRTGLLSLKPEKINAQGYGSAITYEKRYQLSALFGVSSDKDDDGNKATPSNQPRSYQKRQAPPQQDQRTQQEIEHDEATIKNMNDLIKGTVEKIAQQSGKTQEEIQEQVKKAAKANIKVGMSKKLIRAEYLRAAELLAKQYTKQK